MTSSEQDQNVRPDDHSDVRPMATDDAVGAPDLTAAVVGPEQPAEKVDRAGLGA